MKVRRDGNDDGVTMDHGCMMSRNDDSRQTKYTIVGSLAQGGIGGVMTDDDIVHDEGQMTLHSGGAIGLAVTPAEKISGSKK
ncbi:L-aspartate oxidase [Sesbania bispinosa]|nr:L-aspartate oxidase [Sesbania bispinosa]